MPESVDRIDGQTAVSDINSYQNGNYIPLILFFYHLLDFEIISDRFFFFFFFFYENSLSLSLPLSKTPSRRHLRKTKALSVL